MGDEDAADGMNRIMPVEPLAHQARERRLRRHLVSQRGLVLDDDMDRRMTFFARQFDSSLAMMFDDEPQAFAFIQSQPLARIGASSGSYAFTTHLCVR